jgi:hypothetical protein
MLSLLDFLVTLTLYGIVGFIEWVMRSLQV